MNYFDRMVKKARTIETLEIHDILEIVIRDLSRYNIPDAEITNIVSKHVVPLKSATEELKLKYNS